MYEIKINIAQPIPTVKGIGDEQSRTVLVASN